MKSELTDVNDKARTCRSTSRTPLQCNDGGVSEPGELDQFMSGMHDIVRK